MLIGKHKKLRQKRKLYDNVDDLLIKHFKIKIFHCRKFTKI